MSVKEFVEKELQLAEKMRMEDKEFADYNEGRRDALQDILEFLKEELIDKINEVKRG